MKTEFISIEAGKVKPNPFKKYIINGGLSETIIEELIEGFKQTTFHDNLAGRRNKQGEIELIYGHHRLEAVKRCFGKNYKINLKVYSYEDFSDEKMLVDMIRENMTQRGHDFKEMLHSILLVKKWLEGTLLDKKAKPKEVTDVEIARFVSKSGKALSPAQVTRYISIENNLDEEIKEKVEITGRAGKVKAGKVGLEMAFHLSQAEKKDQPYLLAQVEKAGVNKDKARVLITEYRKSDDSLKEKVKKGKLSLDVLPIENMKQEIKKNRKEREKKDKKEIKVIPYKKYLDEVSGAIGEANTEVYKACALLYGLEQSGILFELDWKEVRNLLKLAKKRGEEYQVFVDKIIDKMD